MILTQEQAEAVARSCGSRLRVRKRYPRSKLLFVFYRAKLRHREGSFCVLNPQTGEWFGFDGGHDCVSSLEAFRDVLSRLIRLRWDWAREAYARDRLRYRKRLASSRSQDVRVLSRTALREKIRRLIAVDPVSRCWIYQGAWSKSGYGYINISAETRCKVVTAGRAALYAWRGYPHSNVKGHVASRIETCPNAACCNPRHWRFVSTKESGRIRSRLGRVCQGEANGNSRITAHQAAMIKDALEEGSESVRQIADRLDVTVQTIYHIKQGKSWKHVSGEKLEGS